MTIQIKATEQYFPLVPFKVLYKLIVTFRSTFSLFGREKGVGGGGGGT